MFGRRLKKWGRLLLGGWAVALLAAAPLRAGDPELDDIRRRMDRLEKENLELKETIKDLQPIGTLQVPSRAVKPAAHAPAPNQAGGGDKAAGQGDQPKAGDGQAKKGDDAKDAPKDPEFKEVGRDLSMKGTWRDGLNFETENKDYRVHIGGRGQADFGWFAPTGFLATGFPNAWNDGADFRRARLRADGSMREIIDWVAEVDFATGVDGTTQHPVLTDFYFDIKSLPYLGNFRVGHFKEPFSLEDYGSPDAYTILMERSTSNDAFSPSRNMGFMLYNWSCDKNFTWAAGIFRTNSDNFSGNVFDYGDGEWSYTARTTWTPWYANDGRCWWLLGAAYSFRTLDRGDTGFPPPNGTANPSVARFASRIPIRVGSPVVIDTSALMADNYQLANAQTCLVMGPFSIQSEYYYDQVDNARRGIAARGVPRLVTPAFDGFYVQTTYFLTGENRPLRQEVGGFDRVRPIERFFLVRGDDGSCCSGWGAWELAFRYDYLNLSSPTLDAYPGTPGVPGSSAAAVPLRGFLNDVVFGVNWYLNHNFRIQWNYVHAWKNGPGTAADGDVDAFGMRFAFDF